MLIYGILHAYLKRISRFAAKTDQLPASVSMSHSKLLLYLYNDLTLCKRKILPNIWNMVSQHKYKQNDQVSQVSPVA